MYTVAGNRGNLSAVHRAYDWPYRGDDSRILLAHRTISHGSVSLIIPDGPVTGKFIARTESRPIVRALEQSMVMVIAVAVRPRHESKHPKSFVCPVREHRFPRRSMFSAGCIICFARPSASPRYSPPTGLSIRADGHSTMFSTTLQEPPNEKYFNARHFPASIYPDGGSREIALRSRDCVRSSWLYQRQILTNSSHFLEVITAVRESRERLAESISGL